MNPPPAPSPQPQGQKILIHLVKVQVFAREREGLLVKILCVNTLTI